ncbi:hypothetical protein DERP_010422 [Dermatophagoides pteronyssinus]|uniref:Uncharacterized protein n=1 Tax=Dermatophagoides pteronyssinus TaxID=6956 RepID=A0ABQ8J4U2_DERPT|nr:hypothetical protein DERP_010422 [Dermatophagoides pteronyssinus]
MTTEIEIDLNSRSLSSTSHCVLFPIVSLQYLPDYDYDDDYNNITIIIVLSMGQLSKYKHNLIEIFQVASITSND